jgi:hypothetical protein
MGASLKKGECRAVTGRNHRMKRGQNRADEINQEVRMFRVASGGVDVVDRQPGPVNRDRLVVRTESFLKSSPFHVGSKSSSARATTKLAALGRSGQPQVRSSRRGNATSAARFAYARRYAYSLGACVIFHGGLGPLGWRRKRKAQEA